MGLWSLMNEFFVEMLKLANQDVKAELEQLAEPDIKTHLFGM